MEKKVEDNRSPALSDMEIKEMMKAQRQRIPMSVPTLKMQVPDIPGYRTYWVNDEPGRIPRALRAGYSFVDEEEIELNISTTVSESSSGNGNTDLGSRVSLVVDRTTGQRAYLMKIKTEYYLEDQAAIEEANSRVDKAIRRGRVGQDDDRSDDRDKRYSSNDYEPLKKRREF